MKKEIKAKGEIANLIEVKLYIEVMDLENHMNECNCDDAVKYNFCNTIPHHETHRFCLNCGGYVTPKEEI